MTNSKGEKVEIMFPSLCNDDPSFLYFGNNPTNEPVDNGWEIYLWGEQAIHPLVDFDLSLPKSWFEYEDEEYGEVRILDDQINLPMDMIKDSEKHPNCSKELYRSKERMKKLEQYADPDWTPRDLPEDVYNTRFYNK